MKYSRPSVLIICNDSSNTGAPNQVHILAGGLKKDFKVEVCCPDGWLSEKLSELNIKIHSWPEGKLEDQRKILSELYFNLRPDIIHCHGIRAGIAGRLAQRPKESIIIYTEHLWTKEFHLLNPFREGIQHYYLTQAAKKGDWTIAVSKAVADFIVKKHHVSQKKLSLINCAVSPIKTSKISNEPIVGTLGRISSVKGIPTLLKAVAKVSAKYPDIKCVIAGEGSMLQDCQDLAEILKISDRCEWLGKVNDASELLNKIQIYVQPSTSESFGLAAGEAMLSGRVTIASNVGGLKELITDRVSGLLFPAKDSQALAKSIELVLSDKNLAMSLSEAGQNRAGQYSIERYLTEHQQLYEGFINRLVSK